MRLSVLSHVQLFATLWSIACQAPLSMEFSREECWSRLPFSPPGGLSDRGIKPMSLAPPVMADEFFTTSATGEAQGWFSIAEFFLFLLV